MDIFNKQKVKDLEKQIFQLKMKEAMLPISEHIFNHKQPEPQKVFKISDIEKLQYELNFPRKYNIGDIYKKVYKCVNVIVNTDTSIETATHNGCMISREKINSRTYYFENGNEKLGILEMLKV